VTGTYLERLAARSAASGTVLCVGLDPDPAALPAGFPADVHGIERFARLIVDATADVAAAFKPNLAFFEAFGSSGLAALERVRARIPPQVPVVVDAKRADIGTTASRQAVALFDALGADAVTLNPYLGGAALEPFLERPDRFAYVLCRTSNPGAGEFQDLVVAGERGVAEPLHLHVARRTASWGSGRMVGLVVGATGPSELAAIRAIAPGLAFLGPGVGAQGGDLEAALAAGPATAPPTGARPGGGLLVNVSRGITAGVGTAAAEGESSDPGERIAASAAEWASRLPVLR
jgi:orotidine-5'-phosphate decarboxylase